MTRTGKGARHIRKLAVAKRQKRNATIRTTIVAATTGTPTYLSFDNTHEAHWEGLFESEEESEVEISEPEDNISKEAQNAFEELLNAKTSTDTTNFLYQRASSLSKRQQIRYRNAQRELQQAARTQSQPISNFFSSTSSPGTGSTNPISTAETQQEERQEAIKDLEKKLRSKKTALGVQNLTRHRAVLALLYTTQARKEGETREQLSYQVSRSFNKGVYFGRKLVEWEVAWIRHRLIPEGKQGCHAKTSSWFNDAGVQIAVREWCAGAGESRFFFFYFHMIRKVFRF